MSRCICGHLPNNHFSWGKKPCGQCPEGTCMAYTTDPASIDPRDTEIADLRAEIGRLREALLACSSGLPDRCEHERELARIALVWRVPK